jgi:hypothetical protein
MAATVWVLPSTHGAVAFCHIRYIDDEVDMCESHAILRHVGRKHGLYGKDRKEQARVDEVIATPAVATIWQWSP